MSQQDAYSKLITDGELLLARRIQSGHPFIYDSVDKVAYNQWVMTCVAHFESITPTHARQVQDIYNPDVANVNMVEQILGVVRSGVDFIHTMTASAEDINQTDKPENYNISFWTKAIQKKCKQHFLNGAYDDAIFNATKVLEVTVREKAGLDSKDIGTALIQTAFKPSDPTLRYSDIQAEQVSFMNMLSGLIGVFKNPQSHRFIEVKEPFSAFEIISFVSHVHKILESIPGK